MLRPTLLTGVAAACAAAALVGGGVTWALDAPDPAADPTATASREPFAVQTSFPGLSPAAGEPVLSGTADAAPGPGRVGRVAGPFDDRFDLVGLRLADGRVTGRLHVTSDVSDLIDLQVVASYYDARGELLGLRRFVRHEEEEHQHAGPPSESVRFSLAAPARWRDQVRSAAVGVPVLVNE